MNFNKEPPKNHHIKPIFIYTYISPFYPFKCHYTNDNSIDLLLEFNNLILRVFQNGYSDPREELT